MGDLGPLQVDALTEPAMLFTRNFVKCLHYATQRIGVIGCVKTFYRGSTGTAGAALVRGTCTFYAIFLEPSVFLRQFWWQRRNLC